MSPECWSTLQAHRALNDVHALFELISRRCVNTGELYFAEILADAGREMSQVIAGGKAYDQRERLKARGYTWQGTRRSWARLVPRDQEDSEAAWLGSQPGLTVAGIQRPALHERFQFPYV